MDITQDLDRRGALKRVAAYLMATAVPAQAWSQTLIEGTGETDTGAERFFADPGRPTTAAPARHDVSAAPMDWRKALLSGERSIVMRREGRAERVRYCTADGLLDRDGYARACFLLRDVRANVVFPMLPSLLDALCGIQRWGEYYGVSSVASINSGFRTWRTNGNTEGAAQNSRHPRGEAVDTRFEGFSTPMLGSMARRFNNDGGVGIYLDMNFVHVDRGPTRTWHGSRPKRG